MTMIGGSGNLKKTPLLFLTFSFLVFMIFSVRYNDHIVSFFDRGQSLSQHLKVTYVEPNRPPNAEQVGLHLFSTCNSTKEYSGRRIRPAEGEGGGESGRGNVGSEECDLTSGKWVFDNVTYTLYEESECPYMSDQLACQKHGRADLAYQHWRWQPLGCDLQRWSTTEMWEKLRGKRLMFVGDSLGRGQWISMICLLQSAAAEDKRSITPNSPLTIFRAEEYNATIEFLWAPLLVESNNDHPVNHKLEEKIIRPDSIRTHALKWEQADILVFDTYLWWRLGLVKLSWSDDEEGEFEELGGLAAMELAMETWADWVVTRLGPTKRVFFVTMSPTHHLSQDWNPGSKGNCYGEKEPIRSEGYWGSGSHLPTMRMVERVLGRLGPRVSVINITQLSEYRKDGHPSVYRKFWETLSPEELSNPSSYSDCKHWCLPGVPDVWNQMLFHFL
ncbi:hypothetical protein MLD38_029775 [Melastoma candidum]|uniref:Uncharacterized protein n=1 Tax=Melastoma candidum TaxID=119954 RepID=A0ACB9N4V1_9MYRT|nr:hypothetical protein MLD38_029775 [Melastoma candidum]